MSNNNSSTGNVFQTILLIVLVMFSALQVAFMMGIIPSFTQTTQETTFEQSSGFEKVVREALLQHEYEKVGGKANYEIITALQIAMLKNPQSGQDIAKLQQMLEALGGTGATTTIQQAAQTTTQATTQTAATPAVALNTLTPERQADILSGAVLEGNKDADIVVIEYSDLECPFCILQHNDNQIVKTLKAEYGDKIVSIFKNHRGVNHEGTEVKALGLLCANKLGGAEAYSKFYTAVLGGSTTRVMYDVAKLPELVKEIGLDVAAWQSCVDSKEFIAQFSKETAEGKSFGLSGTPGTLIFNQKTGKYATVVGAHEYPQFKAAVDSLLAE